MTALFDRIFPKQFDNDFEGQRAALWLMGLLLALKLIVSINSMVNTVEIASGADGFPLESYGVDGARAVLMLFALHSLGELALAIVGVAALVRYRSMTPFVFLLLLGEFFGRRLIIRSYAIERSADSAAAFYVNMAFLSLLVLGFALSLWPRRRRA